MKIVIDFFESSFSEEMYSEKKKILVNMENTINQVIKDVNYGESIHLFIIGLICVKQKIDHLFKVRRPKYIADRTIIIGEVKKQIKNTFECELKIDYELMLNSEKKVVQNYIAKEILDTLHHLKKPKKITDFNKERFVSDIELLFKSEYMID